MDGGHEVNDDLLRRREGAGRESGVRGEQGLDGAPSTCWATSGWASPRSRLQARASRCCARSPGSSPRMAARWPTIRLHGADRRHRLAGAGAGDERTARALDHGPGWRARVPRSRRSRCAARRSSSASPSSPWKRWASMHSPTSPACCSTTRTRTPIGPDHAPPAAAALFQHAQDQHLRWQHRDSEEHRLEDGAWPLTGAITASKNSGGEPWICPFPTNRSSCRNRPSASRVRSTRSRIAARSWRPSAAGCRRIGRSSPIWAGSAWPSRKRTAATAAARSRR
jgi:hypothetical protein